MAAADASRHSAAPGRVAAVAMALLAAACDPGAGGDPQAVRELAERAAAARRSGDFAGFVDCFTGEKAGHYREELATAHGDDVSAFFAGKRRMVVTGPVTMRRQAFATVGVFVIDPTGYKPMVQASAVFRDGRWLLDTFVPGDVEHPRTAGADVERVVGLLRAEAASPRPEGGDGSFRRIQLIRALEVVAMRRPPAAALPLMDLLTADRDGGVRQFCAHLLGELGEEAAVPALRRALADRDLRVRGDAARSLARLGDVGSLPELERLAAGDPAEWAREQAAAAVARLRDAG